MNDSYKILLNMRGAGVAAGVDVAALINAAKGV